MKRDEKKIIMFVGIFPEVKLDFRDSSQLSLLNHRAAEKEIIFRLKINNRSEEKIIGMKYLN